MSMTRLFWTVVLFAAALLALPLYFRWWHLITGGCSVLEFLMPRVV